MSEITTFQNYMLLTKPDRKNRLGQMERPCQRTADNLFTPCQGPLSGKVYDSFEQFALESIYPGQAADYDVFIMVYADCTDRTRQYFHLSDTDITLIDYKPCEPGVRQYNGTWSAVVFKHRTLNTARRCMIDSYNRVPKPGAIPMANFQAILLGIDQHFPI